MSVSENFQNYGRGIDSAHLELIRRIIQKNMSGEGGTACGVFIRVARLRKPFWLREGDELHLAFARAEQSSGRAVRAANLIAEKSGQAMRLVDVTAKHMRRN